MRNNLNKLSLFPGVLIIFVIQAYGSQIDELIEKIKQADQLNSNLLVERRCWHCQSILSPAPKLTEKEHNKLLQQCAVDLCDSPQKVLEYNPDVGLSHDLIDIEDIDPEVKESFDKKLRPAVEEFIEVRFNERRKKRKAIEGKIRDIASGDINVYELDEFADSLSDDAYIKKVKNGQINITFPEQIVDTSTGESYTIPDSHILNISFYLHKRVSEVDGEYVPIKEKLKRGKIRKSKRGYIEEELVAFFKSEFRSLLAKIKREELTPQEDKNLILMGNAIKNLSSASGNEKYSYLNVILDGFDYYNKKHNRLFSCAKYDRCKKWVGNSLESLLNQYSIPMKEYKQQELNRCLSIYAVNLQYENKIKDFKNNYEKYKDRFLNRAIPGLSPETKSAFKAFLDHEMEISPPLLVKSAEEFLLDEINITKSLIDNRANKDPDINSALRDEFSFDGKTADLSHACPMVGHFKNTISGDYVSARGKKKKLSISMFSCVNHKHGKNIFAHELAHSFDYWFSDTTNPHSRISGESRKEHQKLRNCVNNKYLQSEIEDPYALFPNDKLRTEEDMADVLSYRVFESDDFLYQCTLLETDKSANQFIVFGKKGLDSLRMIETLTGNPFPDPHSHAIVRILNEAVYKKKPLSPSCKRLIVNYEDRINFNPCP